VGSGNQGIEDSFPPDNVPSVKTTTLIEGKTDKGCRIQVSIRNVLTIPENNIYYCYNAGMGKADDTQNFNHLLINNYDKAKTFSYKKQPSLGCLHKRVAN